MPVLSAEERAAKLRRLAEIEGYDDAEALLGDAVLDSVCPGICTKAGCEYTCEVEPDQDAGYCEGCGGQSVASALVLAELI